MFVQWALICTIFPFLCNCLCCNYWLTRLSSFAPYRLIRNTFKFNYVWIFLHFFPIRFMLSFMKYRLQKEIKLTTRMWTVQCANSKHVYCNTVALHKVASLVFLLEFLLHIPKGNKMYILLGLGWNPVRCWQKTAHSAFSSSGSCDALETRS